MSDPTTEMQARSARINTLLKQGSYADALVESYALRALYEGLASLDADQQRRYDTLRQAIVQLEVQCLEGDAPVAVPGSPRPSLLGTLKEWRQALTVFAVAVFLAGIAYMGARAFQAHQAVAAVRKAHEAYVVQARATLESLEKIQAGTKTGISIEWYGDKLADASYQMQRLDDLVGTAESLKSVSSHRTLKSALASYSSALESWREKIRSPFTSPGRRIYDDLLQTQWTDAATSIAKAKEQLGSES